MSRKGGAPRAALHDHVVGYESSEQRVRPVVLSALALAAVTVLVLLLMKLTSNELVREELKDSRPIHPLADTEKVELPPEPRLQETPALDLARFRAREEERLSTYGWVDRANGVVRIPIERAMEIVAREGLPSRPQQNGEKR